MATTLSLISSILPSNPRNFSLPPKYRNFKKHSIIGISASSSSSSPPETSCPVPFEQQPINEYQSLSTSIPFSWAAADLPLYSSRLAATAVAFSLLLGLPVAAFGSRGVHFDLADDGLRLLLGSASTGLLAVTLAVLRMYLGWAYVGNRLLSATVECEFLAFFFVGENLKKKVGFCWIADEETGWYDGQIWVKTPEVLARDRLLGSFSVKPVLNRVKITLVGLAIALVACALLFINIESPRDSSENVKGRAVPGVYNDASARSFEPAAFCGEPDLS